MRPKTSAAMPAESTPPNEAMPAASACRVGPQMSQTVSASTIVAVMTAATIGERPCSSSGKKKNRKQANVTVRATTDLTPFLPPTSIKRRAKKARKAMTAVMRS